MSMRLEIRRNLVCNKLVTFSFYFIMNSKHVLFVCNITGN